MSPAICREGDPLYSTLTTTGSIYLHHFCMVEGDWEFSSDEAAGFTVKSVTTGQHALYHSIVIRSTSSGHILTYTWAVMLVCPTTIGTMYKEAKWVFSCDVMNWAISVFLVKHFNFKGTELNDH